MSNMTVRIDDHLASASVVCVYEDGGFSRWDTGPTVDIALARLAEILRLDCEHFQSCLKKTEAAFQAVTGERTCRKAREHESAG
jgi:hypothetical protein